MHSEAAPQSVHSSCWTNGTARLPVGKPSFLRAGKPSAMVLLLAMGGESLRAMAGGWNRRRSDGRWSSSRISESVSASVGQVLLDRGQQRCEERLGLDLDLGLCVHAVVVAIGVVSALERAL